MDGAVLIDGAVQTDAGVEAGTASGQPRDFDSELALAPAIDENPDLDVIEIGLEARVNELEFIPGFLTPAWTYNGTLPGPLIQATVGQTLIVHFKNSLPEATSVHWHGLRVENEVDGVPGVTQALIEPGEEYEYRFSFRDAGTYWYHPHYDSVEQMGKGLYGAIVVRDPAEPDLGQELVLMLSDLSIREDGQFYPADAGGDFSRLFGREGNIVLVNGKVNPTLHARAGLRQRWRVINAARSRYMGLAFAGQSFTQLGADGGLQQYPQVLEGPPVIVPGGRADLSVVPVAEGGSSAPVQWVATDRGFGSTFNRPNVDLFTIQYTTESAASATELPPLEREIPAPDTSNAVEHDIELTIDTPDQQLLLGINHQVGDDVPPIDAMIGDTQIWNLSNHSEFAHPFHLHGFFFQQIDDAGKPVEPRAWRDTIDVPIDQPVRIAVHFDERPGMWMYHCHILDHSEGGMMGMVHLH